MVALMLGALLGIERELVGKESAGMRTEMLVSGGAAIFSMTALTLPYLMATSEQTLNSIIASGGFFNMAANIVVGVGFLGAGLIIKTNDHPHGVTTAALVWATAAIGMLAGVGLEAFAAVAAIIIAVLLYVLRKISIAQKMEEKES